MQRMTRSVFNRMGSSRKALRNDLAAINTTSAALRGKSAENQIINLFNFENAFKLTVPILFFL